MALHNANRTDTIDGPAISVSPLQAKLVNSRPSCRNAILDAIDRLHQRTGATRHSRRDIVAEVQAADCGDLAAGRGADVCVLHLIRNTFQLASRRDWDAMARDLRPVYIAATEQAAKERLGEFHATWGERYPAIIRLWNNAWAEFAPFLDCSPEIRRVIYSTNAIESLHARFRRATRARGHFPNEQAALKCLSLVVRSLEPTGKGRQRWMNRWKPALNAFAITFEGRLFPNDNQ
jgi:transposase-like protein